jgi:hypothetical protein
MVILSFEDNFVSFVEPGSGFAQLGLQATLGSIRHCRAMAWLDFNCLPVNHHYAT